MAANVELAAALFDIGAVRLGRFTLHSGRVSSLYLDLRLLISHPPVLRLAAQAYAAVLHSLTFDLLAAIPYAGLPIGTAIALEMNRPLIFPRKTAKDYGTGKSIEGAWRNGQTVVVVEDLITSGDSILDGIAALKAAGLQVREAVVLVDREQGGRAALQAQGYQLHAVFTLTHFLAQLENLGRITPDQRWQALNT